METEQWIESLARRARLEAIPDMPAIAPRIEPVSYRMPRLALSLSALGSLVAACLILFLGLAAQSSSSLTLSSGDSSKVSSDGSMGILFSPLKVDEQP